jgi:hypothetical protein
LLQVLHVGPPRIPQPLVDRLGPLLRHAPVLALPRPCSRGEAARAAAPLTRMRRRSLAGVPGLVCLRVLIGAVFFRMLLAVLPRSPVRWPLAALCFKVRSRPPSARPCDTQPSGEAGQLRKEGLHGPLHAQHCTL